MLARLLRSLLRPFGRRRDTAALAARHLASGDYRQATALYRQLLDDSPQDEDMLAKLGYCHAMLGDIASSEQCFQRLLLLNPDSSMAHMNLGNIALTGHRFTEASRHYENALSASGTARDDPANAGLMSNMGLALQRRGLPEEAIVCFKDLLKGQPQNFDAISSMAFALQHSPDATPGQVFDALTGWAAIVEPPLRSRHRPHANGRDPDRRLRIGYVSGDFFEHAVSNFIEPVLRHHDRGQFEVFCYYNREWQDAQTGSLRSLSDHWKEVLSLDDDAAAEQIVGDGIDILVDLSAHTSGNRLGIFARRPAPVQATYLGYPTTTGLSCVDYRITDATADPPGVAEQFHSEKLLRLPRSQWCYRPNPKAPPLSPLPALRAGKVMFGSFNNLSKLNGGTLKLWGQVLKALPDTCMTVACVVDVPSRHRVADALIANGAAPHQVRILGTLETSEFWRVREEIDIVLDAFPYNGTTTTCEALWSGLPVITLAGACGAARNTTSLLHAVGLQNLVAQDADQFVAIASGLAADLGRLAELREGMRARLLDAGLCDGARFTRELEALYRSAWKAWCASP